MKIDELTFTLPSEKRIEPFLQAASKDSTVVTSPGGQTLARSFHLATDSVAKSLRYPVQDRKVILDQIKIVIDQFYVFEATKQAQYGLDVVHSIERLEPTITYLSDEEFHQSVIEIIARVRDRHLKFQGRASARGQFASLPFEIERCHIQGDEAYVVTRIASSANPQHLKTGARVTHWNGTPIQRHIRLNANYFDGGNEPASIARSVEFLTQRPLYRFAAPFESWVTLTFAINGATYEEKFEWQGFDLGTVPVTPGIGRNAVGYGGDIDSFFSQSMKRVLFAPASFDGVESSKAAKDGTPNFLGTAKNIRYGTVTTAQGSFAYLRVPNFQASDANEIVNALAPLLDKLPKAGLIFDMRGNNGGYIAAGERLLQLFTPRTITPTRFQFRATAGTRMLMEASDEFSAWRKSLNEALLTGAPFTQGLPIEGTDEDANRVGQRYFGPVVVITDALAFSTADMFAAGFIDHDVGRIISTDENMAAAGGNNWEFPVLRIFTPEFGLNLAFETELDAGKLPEGLKDAFNAEGFPISAKATVSTESDIYGKYWAIADGNQAHKIRHYSWLSNSLSVYPARSRLGLEFLPDDIRFGITMRRCIRTGKNEGRQLEDLGIKPDVVHLLTLNDVLNRNQDLILTATRELSGMPGYDLQVRTSATPNELEATCRVGNLDAIEVFIDGRHAASGSVGGGNEVVLKLPSTTTRFVVKGFKANKLVARRIVDV